MHKYHGASSHPYIPLHFEEMIFFTCTIIKTKIMSPLFNPHSIPQSQCQNSSGGLGDVGDSGRLRCLHGKGRYYHFMYVYM